MLCFACVVWGFVIDSLGVSGDPPYEESVSRTFAGASEPFRSSDWGLGIVCWARPTKHMWRVRVPFGETVPSRTTAVFWRAIPIMGADRGPC